MKKLLVLFAASLAGTLLATAAVPPDLLDEVLARGGLTRADVTLTAPFLAVPDLPAEAIPFLLPHTAPLLHEPLRLPLFADSLRVEAEKLGGDAGLLFATLGVRTRYPAFSMGGGANLPEESDLALALDLLKRPPDSFFPFAGSFGEASREPGPSRGATNASRREAARLPEPLRAPLARLLAALGDADRFVRLAWRRVPPATARLAAARPGLTGALPGGAVFFPDVEDAAREVDGESLAYAGLKTVTALERAARELSAAGKDVPGGPLKTLRWEIETPRGRILVAGTGNDVHDAGPAPRFLLIADLGGDDVYKGAVAAARWPEQPVSALLDLSGSDRYDAAGVPAQGSGLGGVGVLWDAGGDDRYLATDRSQGFGQLGAGVLVDAAGNDTYELGTAGQGAALFGAGLLLDRAGDDRYLILHDGQGYGGPGGAGFLVDLEGNDRFEAVRDPARAGRPDPRTDGKAATSNAQGVGVGRRGDGSDGHAWAGGLGALLDLRGDDLYSGGTWCQGAGYWFGTGVLVDAAGDDRYEAVWYAEGSAAHHALGVLLDRAGNDRYTLSGAGGAGLGFGWDRAAGLLVDLGGNDTYRARRLALGAAMQRSIGVFVDAGGDDRYDVELPDEAFGSVDDDPRWDTFEPLAPGWAAPQAGLFLDLGGDDVYPPGRGGNGRTWGTWEEARRTRAGRNLGAGLDVPYGTLPEPLGGLRRPPFQSGRSG